MKNLFLSWSGGKDATLALDSLSDSGEYQICGLLTTVNEHYQRVSMHGLRIALVREQAEALGLPLKLIRLPENVDYDMFERRTCEVYRELAGEGIAGIAFGDIFLEDLRRYREQMLDSCNLQGVYPLWQQDTSKLADYFIRSGYRATVTAINGGYLSDEFCGHAYDNAMLQKLPPKVDPCGENGEFHTFVHDGPVFNHPISFRTGECVERYYGDRNDPANRAYFCDLLAD